VYDRGRGTFPALGGTTSLLYDTRARQLVEHRLSLAGTVRNCAGGATPWGSWISCEEAVHRAGKRLEKDHGWCFEVPAAHRGLVAPVPLADLGRMNHEAVAVDPRTGILYLTEDREDSCLYRFLPKEPGNLRRGGKLQALRVREAQSLDTRNWHRFARVPMREPLAVSWMPLYRLESPDDDLRYQAFDGRGAARFARGEGIAYGDGALWFCCTSGGSRRAGQIWRYVPSPHEGEATERDAPGTLELFLEPDDPAVVDMCDNLTVAPWGDLVVAEDGGGVDRLLRVTPEGAVHPLARNLAGDGEVTGPTFSPDGTTLFFNVQWQGVTVALTGPWERLQRPG
jgi:secreted PhoX family phosphatase